MKQSRIASFRFSTYSKKRKWKSLKRDGHDSASSDRKYPVVVTTPYVALTADGTKYPLVLQLNFHNTAKYYRILDPANIRIHYDGRLIPPTIVHADPEEL